MVFVLTCDFDVVHAIMDSIEFKQLTLKKFCVAINIKPPYCTLSIVTS